jgi:tetratricopeptide (TPR) repeat protein
MSHPKRNQVFFSYSHADSEWLNRFRKTLRPLEQSGQVSLWDDSMIEPGQEWRKEIERALASAKVAVLLVSPDFLNSDFVAKHELPPLLEAATSEGLRILWVAISACLVEETDIHKYQAANEPERPLDILPPPEQQRVIADICRRIKDALKYKTPAELTAEETEEQRARARAIEEEIGRLQAEIDSATVREDWKSAIKDLEALLSIKPADKGANDGLRYAARQQELSTIYLKGNRHYEAGNLYLALTEFRALKVKEDGYKDVDTLIALIESTIKEREVRLRATAQAAAASFEWAEAVKSLEALVRLVPSEEDVRLKLEEAKQNQEKLEGAYNKGLTKLHTNLHEALDYLLQARRLGGSYKEVDSLIADVKLKIQRKEDERQEKVARLRTEAETAVAKKEWPKAIELFRRLQQIDPTDESIKDSLKSVELRQELRELYKKGLGRYRAGKVDGALQYFYQILNLKSDYKDVDELVKRIEREQARRKKLFPRKYYGSLIIGVVGTLIGLYNFYTWVYGYTAQPGWTSLILITSVSWVSLVYSFGVGCSTEHSAEQSRGCLAAIMAILILALVVFGFIFVPGYRSGLANVYTENASHLSPYTVDQSIYESTYAININPNNPLAYYYRGTAYRLKGDYERAVNDISQAINLDPTRDNFFISRALAYHKKQDHSRAFTDFTESIRLNPSSANNYYQRGLAYFNTGDFKHAVSDFDRATKAKPDFVLAFNYLGRAYHMSGDNVSALSCLSNVINIDPNDATAYLYRGQAHAAEKEFDDAIDDFDHAISLDEGLADAYLERGKAYINSKSHDYNQAIIDLGKSLKKDADNFETFYYLGWAHYQLKEYDGAISHLNQAIKLNKDYGDAYDLRGSAHLDVDNYELAISDFSRSIELSEGSKANSYFNRGIAYEKSGDIKNAMADFQKVQEFNTSNLRQEAIHHLRQLSTRKGKR